MESHRCQSVFSCHCTYCLLHSSRSHLSAGVESSVDVKACLDFAGVGEMPFQKFSAYNIGGAILWSSLFVSAGALLGNVPAVKHNFSIVSECLQLSLNAHLLNLYLCSQK